MNELNRKDTYPRSSMTIQVRGVLDMAQAVHVAASFRDIPHYIDLYVDVRSAREVHDAAFVALAQAVALRNGVLVGLTRHHAMLLDYVGQPESNSAP